VVELLRKVVRTLKLTAKLRALIGRDNDNNNEEDHPTTNPNNGKQHKLDLAKAAQLVHEISSLVSDPDVMRVEAVSSQRAFIEDASSRVRSYADVTLRQGMDTLSQADVGSTLQVYYNLNEMQDAVNELTKRYTVQISSSIGNALDATSIASSSGGGDHPRGGGNKAPSTTKWRELLWHRLTSSMDTIYSALIAMWHLQRVASKKRDPITHVCFIDVLVTSSTSTIITNEEQQMMLTDKFWNTFVEVITQHLTNAFKSSGFIKDALIECYPRLYNLFNDLIHRVQRDTDIRNVVGAVPHNGKQVLMHNALSMFKDAFLALQTQKYESVMNLLFRTRNTPPSRNDAIKVCNNLKAEICKTVNLNNQAGIDAAAVAAVNGGMDSIDIDMSTLITTSLSSALYTLTERIDYYIVKTPDTKQVTSIPSSAQLKNFAMCGILSDVHSFIVHNVMTILPSDAALELTPALQDMFAIATDTLQPLFHTMTTRLEETIASVHDEYNNDGGKQNHDQVDTGSIYIRNFSRQLQSFNFDFLSKLYPVRTKGSGTNNMLDPRDMPLVGNLCVAMASRVCLYYVRHASLLRPLSDADKLSLTNDIDAFEKSINTNLVSLQYIGKAYKALQSLKPLLFLETTSIPQSLLLHNIPLHAVLHHVLGRAPPELQSPHVQSGVTLTQYSVWMDRHNDKDVWQRVQQCMEVYSRSNSSAVQTNEVYKALQEIGLKIVKNDL